MSDLPDQVALVHVVRGDPAPWWLDERHSLHAQNPIFSSRSGDEVHIRSLGVVHEADHPGQGVGVHVKHAGFWIEGSSWPVRAVRHEEQSELSALAADDRWGVDRAGLV